MRQFSFCFTVASLLSFGLSLVATAANYPTDAYDATYKRQKMIKQVGGPRDGEYVNDGGVSDYRFATDGQGRIRIETEPPNAGIITGQTPSRIITIFDFSNGESYILYEKQKIAQRSPLKRDASMAPIDDQRVKELNGKSLGARNISGHKCHGWEYELNGCKNETWTADDLKCPIDTYTMNADGSLDVMHLFRFSNRIPPSEEFNVPDDFKITSGVQSGKVQ